MIVVLAGVSGVGKTTVGRLLARDLGWQFLDADDFHPESNIEKMRAGVPLTDQDRREWLDDLRSQIELFLEREKNLILACSALKRAYRDVLAIDDRVKIFLLDADIETVRTRTEGRADHFMPPELLQSQFEMLERLDAGVEEMTIDASQSAEEIAGEIARRVHQI